MGRILVTGAGGFIGGHLVNRLVEDGEQVVAVDSKALSHWFQLDTVHHKQVHNMRVDLRERSQADLLFRGVDEVYHLAANMGGMGHIHSAETEIMHDNVIMNANLFDAAARASVGRVFFSSSVCVYRDMAPGEPELDEDGAYPAQPDNEYGWEKLYSERALFAYGRRYGLAARVARFQNCFGPHGEWIGGREKAPAAICRKVAEAGPGGVVDVWGDGTAVRSYTYVDDLVDGIVRIARSDHAGPVNVGSSEYVTVDELVEAVCGVAGYEVGIKHVDGPVGVRSRNFSNGVVERLGWKQRFSLHEGLERTWPWIREQVERARTASV